MRVWHIEKWLFTAWTFGHKHLFKHLIEQLMDTLQRNEAGEILSMENTPLKKAELPPALLGKTVLKIFPCYTLPNPVRETEKVVEAREEALNSALKACYEDCDSFLSKDNSFCGNFQDGAKCDAICFGSLVKSLQAQALWPLQKDTSTYHGSIQYLLEAMAKIEIFTYPHTAPNAATHAPIKYGKPINCDQIQVITTFKHKLVNNVETVREAAIRKVVARYEQHLEKQERKCAAHSCTKRACLDFVA